MIHLANPPVNNPLHLGVANLTDLSDPPVNNCLHPGVANLTHLANQSDQRTSVGSCPYNVSAAQNTEGNKALSALLVLNTPSALSKFCYRALAAALWAKKSPLPSPKFRLGADYDAACAKRDERQFSKAAQARNCPDARRFSSRVNGGTGEG